MKNLNKILDCLFIHSTKSNALHFPLEESFKVHLGEATPEEVALVEDWKTQNRAIREETLAILKDLGVENPERSLSHFETLHSL